MLYWTAKTYTFCLDGLPLVAEELAFLAEVSAGVLCFSFFLDRLSSSKLLFALFGVGI